jgi:hypothetical protein
MDRRGHILPGGLFSAGLNKEEALAEALRRNAPKGARAALGVDHLRAARRVAAASSHAAGDARLSRDLLIRGITYKLQERAYGGGIIPAGARGS